MKYRVLITIIALLATLSIAVYAVGYEYAISANEGYITAEAGDDLNQAAKKLNMTTHDLHNYFTQNGLIYLAVSPDNQTQVKISAFSDNLSSKVEDISYLDDAGLSAFIAAISEDSESPAQLVENNGRKYLYIKDTLSDSGGVYTVTQYITICNNKTFYFTGYNPGEDTSNDINTMFESFTLKEIVLQNDLSPSKKFDWKYFWIYAGVAIFGVVAVISIVSLINGLVKNRKEQF